MVVTTEFLGQEIVCQMTTMGKDTSVLLYGGQRPHIGSVVVAIPRDSLTGEGRSVTSSVLNLVGHKEESVARLFAERIAVAKDGVVTCCCGIHYDDLGQEELERLQTVLEGLLSDVLVRL